MNTLELKNKIKSYLDFADKDLLLIIQALLEREMNEKDISEEQKSILDERLKFHKTYPEDGNSWEEIYKRLLNENEL